MIGGGIPFEIVTMLGSTLLGGMLKIWGMKQEHEKLRTQALIQLRQTEQEMLVSARTYENKGFQFTRRTLAIMAFLSIIVLPKLVPILGASAGWTDVVYGWTEWHPGFLWMDGQNVTEWKQISGGIVITPLDTHVISAIIGLYFGSSTVGHNR